VRPTNKTNLAARSESEKKREWPRTREKEIDKHGEHRTVLNPPLDHPRDDSII
jgi:hypothetical protein